MPDIANFIYHFYYIMQNLKTLEKASKGAALAAGGLNIPEIKEFLSSKNIKFGAKATRSDLNELLSQYLKSLSSNSSLSLSATIVHASSNTSLPTKAPVKKSPSPKVQKTPPQKAQKQAVKTTVLPLVKMPSLTADVVSKNLKKWRSEKPKSNKERTDLMKTCTPKCYLVPQRLAYPICSSDPMDCKINCSGLRAATARARLITNNPNVKQTAINDAVSAYEKAVVLGREHCDWE